MDTYFYNICAKELDIFRLNAHAQEVETLDQSF